MGLNVASFTGAIVSDIVCFILVVIVAVPIISDNKVTETVANASSINAMLGIIPLLIVVGVVIFVIAAFIGKGGRD